MSGITPVPFVHGDVHRFGNADGVGDLNLTLRGETGGNDVLGDIAAGIGSRERSAFVGSLPEKAPPQEPPYVSTMILRTGQTAVAPRTAYTGSSGRSG